MLFRSDICPVGEDQVQHVELARDIAKRFNATYNQEVFKLPVVSVNSVGKRIKSLQDPLKKMSKSETSSKGTIYLVEDDEKSMRKKIMSAVTDTGSEVYYDEENKPGISNLLQIYCSMKNISIDEAVNRFKGYNYGSFKKEVADAVIEELSPFISKFKEYRSNESYLNSVLQEGACKAQEIAKQVLDRVKKVVGLK